MRHTLLPWLSLVLLLTLTFTLCGRLTATNTDDKGGAETDPVLDFLLGGGRAFMGDYCFKRADLYLHRGQGHTVDTGFTNRFFQRLGAQVSPPQVEHVSDANAMREILPWMAFAARAAPDNKEYVLSQAYMLRVVGEDETALELLRQARARLPDCPELTLDEARLHLSAGRWRDCAAMLDVCRRQLHQMPAAAADQEMLAEASTLRGLLHENDGQIAAAVACYEQAASVSPLFSNITARAATLRRNEKPTANAQHILNLRAKTKLQPHCRHHGHHHDHQHEDEHQH